VVKKIQRKRPASLAIAALVVLGATPFSAYAFLATSADDTFAPARALQTGATYNPKGDKEGTGHVPKGQAPFVITRFDTNASELRSALTLRNQANADNMRPTGLGQFTFGAERDTVIPVPWSATDSNRSDPGSTVAVKRNDQTTGGTEGVLPAGEYGQSDVTLRFADAITNGVEFSPFAVKYQSEKDSQPFPGSGNDCIAGAPDCSGTPSGEVPTPVTLALFALGALLSYRRFLKTN